MEDTAPICARCPYSYSDRFCNTVDGKFLPSCPTEKQRELLSKSLKEYEKPEILEFARQASIQEAEGYEKINGGDDCVKPIKPRIVEIIEFAEKMKYTRIGFVFCEGLAKEITVKNLWRQRKNQ